MKTTIEIGADVLGDWHSYYYKVSEPDESNMGDVADWARREYVRELLGIFSCTFCHKWYESVYELAEHLSKEHNTKILYEPRYTGYSEYVNAYIIDSRIYDSSTSKVKGEEE